MPQYFNSTAAFPMKTKKRVYAKGGRAGFYGGGRTDLLEELGRVEGERSNPNRRAEISRVHSELNRGYKTGGRAGFSTGSKKVDITTEKFKKYYEGKPGIPKEPKKRKKYQEHWDKAEKNKQKRLAIEAMKPEDAGFAQGGRAGFKHGSTGVEHGRPAYKGRKGSERVEKKKKYTKEQLAMHTQIGRAHV